MKKFVSAIALASTILFAGAVSAEQLYSFSNVSINKLDWSNGTVERAPHHKDFDFIEVEAGAGYDWGTVYGFVDFEDFANYESSSDIKISAKLVTTFATQYEGIEAYHQTFVVASDGFDVVDSVVGVSYQMRGENWSVRPFLGTVYTQFDNDYTHSFSGANGAMLGWLAMYQFKVAGEDFALSNWNEITFGRDATYLEYSGEKSKTGVNGAAALWWNVSPRLTTGIQYRYGDSKLGSAGRTSAAIYTVKYNF